MVSDSIQFLDRGGNRSGRSPRNCDSTAEFTIRHRLEVVAPTVVDAVEFAGGLVCDRAIAGWAATVIVAEESDPTPLQILGAQVVGLDDVLNSTVNEPDPHTVVVAADLIDSDARVRRGVLWTLTRRGIEVMLWGEPRHASIANRRFALVEHRLTVAARAFKAHALAATVHADAPIAVSERFHSRRVMGTSASTDVIPAS